MNDLIVWTLVTAVVLCAALALAVVIIVTDTRKQSREDDPFNSDHWGGW